MKKQLILLLILCGISTGLIAQSYGNSDPSPTLECGEYQWPEVQSPCPEVQIKQKHDHTSKLEYREQGWDTAATCAERTIILSCMPYIPTQYFNGQYTVDTIPYNPPDTTFYLNGLGTKMDINEDDRFAPSAVTLGYPFFFFGFQKTQFRIGDNGLVTFCSNSDYSSDYSIYSPENYCPWAFSKKLPWKDSIDVPDKFMNRMRDAIYGVYQDTHVLPSTVTGNQGIYYGILDSFPCRKIIASWNDIPLYPSQVDNRCTYQIVCYEGSNIIEVHIKRRGVNTSWQDGRGIIGIQNATGKAQERGSVGTPTQLVTNGAPAAFWPVGRNNYHIAENYTAYRFTPQGRTAVVYEWIRIFDDGRDSVVLSTDPADTNGYMTPMDASSTCPTLTTAIVTPTETSYYVFHMRFRNANNDWYDLRDTIVIGMDTANTTNLYPVGKAQTTKVYDICAGTEAALQLSVPSLQVPTHTVLNVSRISGGDTIALDTTTTLTHGTFGLDSLYKTMPITLNATLPDTGVMKNKIDSIYVQASCDYASGCTNYDYILVRIFPNFDTTEVFTICKGDPFVWSADGLSYTSSAKVDATLTSQPGCDSIVHLDLTVLDVSYKVDVIEDCKPVTWLNGTTYETSNTATRTTDTIKLQNMYGCDSIVQLDLTIYPLTARIQASRSHFTFDNLTVELSDISTNSNYCLWRFPGGGTSTSSIAWYTIPTELDSAEIWLISRSPYGCIDSTSIVLPLHKETFWVPNIFMPNNENGNNLFGSISQRTLTQEMYIYNRYGALIYSCDTPDCTWDGRDLNGNNCPQGTYVYYIRYTNEFEPLRVHVLKGTVTLIR